MLTEEAIAQVNKLLDLCDAYLINQSEIDFLNKIGESPASICEYYDTTQKVLDARSVENVQANDQLKVLAQLAPIDGCEITLKVESVPKVNIPYYGGGLDE